MHLLARIIVRPSSCSVVRLTLREFEERTWLRNSYYLSGLKCVTHLIEDGVVSFKDCEEIMKFDTSKAEDQQMKAYLKKAGDVAKDKLAGRVLVQKRGRIFEVNVSIPEAGPIYDLKLFHGGIFLGQVSVKCARKSNLADQLWCTIYAGAMNTYLTQST